MIAISALPRSPTPQNGREHQQRSGGERAAEPFGCGRGNLPGRRGRGRRKHAASQGAARRPVEVGGGTREVLVMFTASGTSPGRYTVAGLAASSGVAAVCSIVPLLRQWLGV